MGDCADPPVRLAGRSRAWGYRVPVACGGVLVLPGDVIVADGDGAVVVPLQLAGEAASLASNHEEWELLFSRQRIDEGGRLSKYYPLNEEATAEYEQWKRRRPTRLA